VRHNPLLHTHWPTSKGEPIATTSTFIPARLVEALLTDRNLRGSALDGIGRSLPMSSTIPACQNSPGVFGTA
jgi:hypothetical protein